MSVVQGTITDTGAKFVFPVDVSIVAVARDVVAAMLRLWGLPDQVGDGITVTSELVTNAILASIECGESSRVVVKLAVSKDGTHVLFCVWNAGSVVPALPTGMPPPGSQSKRGLPIVLALCDRVVARRVRGGVQLECALPAA